MRLSQASAFVSSMIIILRNARGLINMSNIQDALVSVGLEKYLETFISFGYTSLDQLTKLSPSDLDKFLSDIGMLKGHTFKFKKLIDDAKQGVVLKPAPQAYNYPPPRIDLGTSDGLSRVPDVLSDKDVLSRASTLKSQLSSIVESKENIISSLKQFAELDLDTYQESLMQLKNIQLSVMELLNTEVNLTV